jgi:NACHT domain-containing protein
MECYVPFVIPLRYFAEGDLPAPDKFPEAGLKYVLGPVRNPSWTHDLLEQGKGLILVDGVDELPYGPARDKAREWLQNLVASYPRCRYIVTSRPTAIPDD